MFLNYPYTDLYSLNLDWIIKAIKEVQDLFSELGTVVNSINGLSGAVTIDKAFITNLLGNYLESFNGRSGEVALQSSDVNNLSIEILYVSDPGDVILDYTQDDLDAFWASGKRIMILCNNEGIPDRMYVLTLIGDVVTPQAYIPTGAQSGVISINGESGVVTLTGADLDVSGTDTTTVAAKLTDLNTLISAETTSRGAADTALAADISSLNQQIVDLDTEIDNMAFTRVDYTDADVIIVQGATAVYTAAVTVIYNNAIMMINGLIVLSGILNTPLQISIPNPTGKNFATINGAAQIGRRTTVNGEQVVLYGDPAQIYTDGNQYARLRFDERNILTNKYAADYGEYIISCVVKFN